jgi:hypothetical protein
MDGISYLLSPYLPLKISDYKRTHQRQCTHFFKLKRKGDKKNKESEGKNSLGNWPGETRSTRRVDPGPGPPGQTRVRPGQFLDQKNKNTNVPDKSTTITS